MQQPSALRRSRGMTLIELMVAMSIGLVIALAAMAALSVARRGFTTVDSASQLRDNARYTRDILNRLIVQAGFVGVKYSTLSRKNDANLDPNPPPNIYGFNNAKPDVSNGLTASTASGVVNNSDVLILRYQAEVGVPTASGAAVVDQSMVTCSGDTPGAAPSNRDNRMVSILYVGTGSSGEPALMCNDANDDSASITKPGQPLVEGVESFQVLYGIDGVTPGAPTPKTVTVGGVTMPNKPNIADRYLRADQLTVTSGTPASNQIETYNNWRRVRSIRLGIVLRGAPNSAQESSTPAMNPFGAAANLGDNATILPAGTDGRLRQSITFTVHLRNYQDLI
ncbi:PilW family protein [Xylophilus ampelinus]|nr:PilW family protein [Xylophilus ampelinus]MCS4509838.1 PilW family protein [Xylophilus ampelinus]